MIGIHIISHGEFSQGAVEALRMIAGNTEQIAYSILSEEDTVDCFRQKILEQSRALDTGQGVLVFVDLFGATTYNCAYYNSKFFESGDYQVIAGFNLPLLIEAVGLQPYSTLNDLVLHLHKTVAETIVFHEDN
jgi:PTS system mannose-specific IIA component